MEQESLKPCPFCGEKARMGRFDTRGGVTYRVSCDTVDCYGESDHGDEGYVLPEYASEEWNRRV